MLEIAHDFADTAHDSKGVGVLPDDGGQGGDLGFVDDADQDVGFPAGVHALAGDQSGGILTAEWG